MEGMPKLPMIAVDFKYSVGPIDFAEKIKEYIFTHYDDDPAKYDQALVDLNQLREQVCRSGGNLESINRLKKYYSRLLMLKSRFPLEAGDSNAITFTWYDKNVDTPAPVGYDDINFEIACIMHNIAAAHSGLAAAENRANLESIKLAFTHFQCAAWAMSNDQLNAANFSVDFDSGLVTFCSNLMLAQAQECILEKSLIDHRKNAIVAKIAANLKEVYGRCKNQLDNSNVSDIVGGSKFKEWSRTCLTKSDLYAAMACLYMGQQADDEKKMGERLAWYDLAVDYLNKAIKTSGKDKRDEVRSALQFARDVLVGKQENAKKENDFIYHDRVPSADDLPEIQGVSLVKTIGFDPLDPAICGDRDPFGPLVPLNVLKSVSIYCEDKAKFWRAISDRVDAKDLELKNYLESLKLDEINIDQATDECRLPDMLMERSAAFNAQPDAFPTLLDSLQRVGYCATEADDKLAILENRLSLAGKCEQIKNDAGFLAVTKELYRLAEAHKSAKAANSELQRAIAAHSENLRILAMPLLELNRRLAGPVVRPCETPEGAQLKRILDKTSEMQTQRTKLLSDLKTDIHNDDPTNKLLAEKNLDNSDIYEKELAKHDKSVAVIDQNLAAQTNILSALTEANANFAHRRRELMDMNAGRSDQVIALVAAYDVYADVKGKSEEGRRFYATLFEKVRSLDEVVEAIEEASSEHLTREREEARQKMEMNKKLEMESGQRLRQRQMLFHNQPNQHQQHTGFNYQANFQPPLDQDASSAAQKSTGPRLADYLDAYRASKQQMSQLPQMSQMSLGRNKNVTMTASYDTMTSPASQSHQQISLQNNPQIVHGQNEHSQLNHPDMVPQQMPAKLPANNTFPPTNYGNVDVQQEMQTYTEGRTSLANPPFPSVAVPSNVTTSYSGSVISTSVGQLPMNLPASGLQIVQMPQARQFNQSQIPTQNIPNNTPSTINLSQQYVTYQPTAPMLSSAQTHQIQHQSLPENITSVPNYGQNSFAVATGYAVIPSAGQMNYSNQLENLPMSNKPTTLVGPVVTTSATGQYPLKLPQSGPNSQTIQSLPTQPTVQVPQMMQQVVQVPQITQPAAQPPQIAQSRPNFPTNVPQTVTQTPAMQFYPLQNIPPYQQSHHSSFQISNTAGYPYSSQSGTRPNITGNQQNNLQICDHGQATTASVVSPWHQRPSAISGQIQNTAPISQSQHAQLVIQNEPQSGQMTKIQQTCPSTAIAQQIPVESQPKILSGFLDADVDAVELPAPLKPSSAVKQCESKVIEKVANEKERIMAETGTSQKNGASVNVLTNQMVQSPQVSVVNSSMNTNHAISQQIEAATINSNRIVHMVEKFPDQSQKIVAQQNQYEKNGEAMKQSVNGHHQNENGSVISCQRTSDRNSSDDKQNISADLHTTSQNNFVDTSSSHSKVMQKCNATQKLSLNELMNPETFQIGIGDAAKLAKKQTKKMFVSGQKAPLPVDNYDPFSDLDPLHGLRKE